jgi:Tfp pilus assembly protein PilO
MIRRVALVPLVGLLVVVGGWFGLFWHSESSHLHKLDSQRAQAINNVDQLQGELAALKALQLKTPAEQAALAKLEQAVPEGPSLDQLLYSLNDAALNAGVTLSSISTPTPSGWAGATSATPSPATGPGPQSLNLSLSVNGSNLRVLRFVNALDSEKRLFVVDNFSLNGSTEGATGAATVMGSTTMTVQAYFITAGSDDPASLFTTTPAARA